jgi:hypothetical protein
MATRSRVLLSRDADRRAPRFPLAAPVCLVILQRSRAASAVINVDSRGQGVPDGEVAMLTTDLHCDAGSTAVTLGANAALDLNDHTIVRSLDNND